MICCIGLKLATAIGLPYYIWVVWSLYQIIPE